MLAAARAILRPVSTLALRPLARCFAATQLQTGPALATAVSRASPPAAEPTQWIRLPIVQLDGKPTDDVAHLHPFVFGMPTRKDILHRVVHWQLNKRRCGLGQGKTRGEVSGGGRKPRPQKGSGESRQGSTRSPLWRHGGKAFPKRKRSFETSLQKKVRSLGLRTALSARLREGSLFVIANDRLASHKTSSLRNMHEQTGWGRVLIITGENVDPNFVLASSNIYEMDFIKVGGANVYDILRHKTTVLTMDAVEALHKRFEMAWAGPRWQSAAKRRVGRQQQKVDPPIPTTPRRFPRKQKSVVPRMYMRAWLPRPIRPRAPPRITEEPAVVTNTIEN